MLWFEWLHGLYTLCCCYLRSQHPGGVVMMIIVHISAFSSHDIPVMQIFNDGLIESLPNLNHKVNKCRPKWNLSDRFDFSNWKERDVIDAVTKIYTSFFSTNQILRPVGELQRAIDDGGDKAYESRKDYIVPVPSSDITGEGCKLLGVLMMIKNDRRTIIFPLAELNSQTFGYVKYAIHMNAKTRTPDAVNFVSLSIDNSGQLRKTMCGADQNGLVIPVTNINYLYPDGITTLPDGANYYINEVMHSICRVKSKPSWADLAVTCTEMGTIKERRHRYVVPMPINDDGNVPFIVIENANQPTPIPQELSSSVSSSPTMPPTPSSPSLSSPSSSNGYDDGIKCRLMFDDKIEKDRRDELSVINGVYHAYLDWSGGGGDNDVTAAEPLDYQQGYSEVHRQHSRMFHQISSRDYVISFMYGFCARDKLDMQYYTPSRDGGNPDRDGSHGNDGSNNKRDYDDNGHGGGGDGTRSDNDCVLKRVCTDVANGHGGPHSAVLLLQLLSYQIDVMTAMSEMYAQVQYKTQKLATTELKTESKQQQDIQPIIDSKPSSLTESESKTDVMPDIPLDEKPTKQTEAYAPSEQFNVVGQEEMAKIKEARDSAVSQPINCIAAPALFSSMSNVNASNVNASNVNASNVNASNVNASNVNASNVNAKNLSPKPVTSTVVIPSSTSPVTTPSAVQDQAPPAYSLLNNESVKPNLPRGPLTPGSKCEVLTRASHRPCDFEYAITYEGQRYQVKEGDILSHDGRLVVVTGDNSGAHVNPQIKFMYLDTLGSGLSRINRFKLVCCPVNADVCECRYHKLRTGSRTSR